MPYTVDKSNADINHADRSTLAEALADVADSLSEITKMQISFNNEKFAQIAVKELKQYKDFHSRYEYRGGLYRVYFSRINQD